MRYLKKAFNTALLAALATGCTTIPDNDLPPREQEVRIETVPVVVAVPCVSAQGKPDKVVPLNERMTRKQWDAKPTGAKAQAVRGQAGRRLNYEDELAASTAGCN